MDVMNMEGYDAETFDVVLDKALLDTLICDENPSQSIGAMLSEIYRVLNKNGVFICISHGTMEQRFDRYFNTGDLDWQHNTRKMKKPKNLAMEDIEPAYPEDDENNFYWVYIMRKQAVTDTDHTDQADGADGAAATH